MQRQELLKVAKRKREWLSSKGHKKNTFSVIFDNGECHDHINRVCYQALLWQEYSRRAIFITDMAYTHLSKKLSEKYINWWVNDSFVADAFITKEEGTILEKGSILDCSYPASYVVLAMIGLRYMWEFPQVVQNWEKFKKHVPYDAAIIMAHMFSTHNNTVWEGKFKSINSNHMWFQNYWNKKEFTQVVNHDLSSLSNLPSMSKDLNYRPLISIFSSNRPGQCDDKGNLIYPKRTKKRILENTFGVGSKKTIYIYDEVDMEEWIRETFELNYLRRKGNKDEG